MVNLGTPLYKRGLEIYDTSKFENGVVDGYGNYCVVASSSPTELLHSKKAVPLSCLTLASNLQLPASSQALSELPATRTLSDTHWVDTPASPQPRRPRNLPLILRATCHSPDFVKARATDNASPCTPSHDNMAKCS